MNKEMSCNFYNILFFRRYHRNKKTLKQVLGYTDKKSNDHLKLYFQVLRMPLNVTLKHAMSEQGFCAGILVSRSDDAGLVEQVWW